MEVVTESYFDNFEKKYYLYKSMLFRLAFAYMGNVYDTEDILQRAFFKLYSCNKKFPTQEDEKRWLIRVTLNLCKDEKKSFWNRNRQSMEAVGELSYEREEAKVFELVKSLPDKYKACIHLHYIEGYSVTEISEILNISASAVKMRLKRGREKLKLELEEDL